MAWMRWTSWFLLSVYWGAIFTLTHLPGEQLRHFPQFWDKAEHFLAYFLLATLLGSALMLTFPHRSTIPLWVLVIGFTYGAVDELLQPLVTRTADFNDWVADALGVWAGVLILWLLRKLPVFRRAMSELPAT